MQVKRLLTFKIIASFRALWTNFQFDFFSSHLMRFQFDFFSSHLMRNCRSNTNMSLLNQFYNPIELSINRMNKALTRTNTSWSNDQR